MDLFVNDIPFIQMNLKKVQCRWHRFPPCNSIQGRLLPSPTLAYQKYKPYRLGMSKWHTNKKSVHLIAQMNASLRKKAATYSPALPYLTKVYHRTNWGVEGKQKKRPFDCSNERFVRKKTATYSPALPYLTRCTIGA